MNKYYNGNAKGGAGNKKMKKFPRIIDYLEAHHKDIYDLIDDLAMHGALTPKRGGSITFLIPDKKYIAKIRKSIESDKPEEATDMIGSLILLDLFETANDFAEKQDDIPNLLGKKVVIKGISGNKVVVDDGELTIDGSFKPFERQGNSKRGNLAVWEMKGEIKYVDAPKSTFKYARMPSKGSKKTEGGCELTDKLIDKITSEEVECIKTGKRGSDGFVSPMLNAVARVLRGLENNAQLYDEYCKARSVLTKHPIIDFYLLFKSIVFDHNKIIDAYTLGAPDMANNVDTITGFFQKPIDTDVATMNPNLLNIANQARDLVRDSVQEHINLQLNEFIKKAYEILDEENMFELNDSKIKVYPECLINIYRSMKGSHLALDEAMYFIYRRVKLIKDSTPDDWSSGRMQRANEYESLFKDIKNCFPVLGHAECSMIAKPPLDSSDIYQSNDFWKEFGLYLPNGAFDNDANERVVRGGGEYMDMFSKDLVDVNREIEDDLCHYDNSDFSLSNDTVNELKAYLKANNGKYPEL